MNLISDSIKCTKCKEILKIPVLLPCGHSICNHHVNVDENESKSSSSSLSGDTNNENRKFECLICEKFHDIPLNGFLRERALESLLEKNIAKIDLGEEYKSAIDKCSLFSDLLERFTKIKNDPDTRINQEISELKNKVDLRREEMKQKIDKESLEMIEKLDEFDKECKLKAVSLKFDSKLDEKLNNSQKSLQEWQKSLNSFERNLDNWTLVLNESTSTLKDLHLEFINFNREIFLNRLIEFKYPNLLASNKFIKLK